MLKDIGLVFLKKCFMIDLKNMRIQLHHEDSLDWLKGHEPDCIDALVTDPPAGISFMGKSWDDDKGGRKEWISWMSDVMSECLRVMKPGAHGLVWAIPRTSHWTATALEDAGFEIRDVITHHFGSGFPKSHDISKAIDKAAGVKTETPVSDIFLDGSFEKMWDAVEPSEPRPTQVLSAAIDAAKEWQGWGTALKPASEHWILIRKPCSEKTVAANVLKWGVGGLNIDRSRIGSGDDRSSGGLAKKPTYKQSGGNQMERPSGGRFPANLILSCSPNCTEEAHDMFECPIAIMDEQSGHLQARGNINSSIRPDNGMFGNGIIRDSLGNGYKDSGGASRFFYCAKASKSDKNVGLEGMPEKESPKLSGGTFNSFQTNGGISTITNTERKSKNHHPTVKSTKLMQYLIKLITPPNGVVLDPFMGSGSTGVAAKALGMGFVGIEREAEYFEIAKKRVGK